MNTDQISFSDHNLIYFDYKKPRNTKIPTIIKTCFSYNENSVNTFKNSLNNFDIYLDN